MGFTFPKQSHRYRSTSANSPCISLPVVPLEYKYGITARYSTLDEKHAFASLSMFDIQYLIEE